MRYYFTAASKEVEDLLTVASGLDAFFDRRYAETDEHRPRVTAHLSAWYAELTIDDFVLWDSENHGEEELTFDKCLARWRRHAEKLMEPFA